MTLFWLGFCVGVMLWGLIIALVLLMLLFVAAKAVRQVDPGRRPGAGVAPPVGR